MKIRLQPSVAHSIFILTALLLLLMAAVTVFNGVMMRRVSAQLETVQQVHVPVYGMLARAHIRSLEQSLTLRLAIIARLDGRDDWKSLLGERDVASAALDQELAQARQTVTEEKRRNTRFEEQLPLGRLDAQLDEAIRDRAAYRRLAPQVDDALRSGDYQALFAALARIDGFRNEVNEKFESMRVEMRGFALQAIEAAQQSQSLVIDFTVVALVAAILAGLLIAVRIAGRLIGQLRRLVVATKAVEGGNYSDPLPVASNDELGQLARTFNLMLIELQLKERLRETFGKFVDPRLVRDLVDRPELLSQGGERRVMTVYFCDMRGFTAMSEQITPPALVSLLNAYFSELSEEIGQRQGIIDKYIGDAIMAFWGPPFTDAGEHPRLAAEAALAQLDRFAAFRRNIPELIGFRGFLPEIGLRIGIATGDVIVGSVGSRASMSFTVMGDTVNVASRLEGLNKLYGTSILVNAETAGYLDQTLCVREIDRVRLVGKSEDVRVYEILGLRERLPASTLELLERYGAGLAAYREGRWQDAEAAFQSCLDLAAEDGPARTLLARVRSFQSTPPAAGWDGIWAVNEK